VVRAACSPFLAPSILLYQIEDHRAAPHMTTYLEIC
jgi:hypothetical protein